MFITVLVAMIVTVVGLYVAIYVLYGIGLFGMLKSCGYKKPWFAYLPFFRVFSLGCLAEICEDGRPPKKYSRLLLIFAVTSALTTLVYNIVIFILTKDYYIGLFEYISQSAEMTDVELETVYTSIMTKINDVTRPALMLSLLNSLANIVYTIYTVIVLVRVYRIFAPEKMFIYLILSVIISPSKAIIFFLIRKNQPKNLRWQQENVN